MRITFLSRCFSILPVVSSIASCHIIPTRETKTSIKQLAAVKVETLYQFSNITWAENLAIRSNGQILVSRLDLPIIVQVDPTNKVAPVTVASFPSPYYASVLGLTETINDVFYAVVQPPVNATAYNTTAHAAIYEIDMSFFKLSSTGMIESPAKVTKVTDISDGQLLNAAVTLDSARGLILVADSTLGLVWRVNVHTGAYSIAINDQKMKSNSIPVGINGLKLHDGYAYWTNSANPVFARIPINANGDPIGPSEVVATPIEGEDDFVFGCDGTAWIMQSYIDEITTVKDGVITASVAMNSSSAAGFTAAKFGRLPADKDRLYITTSGNALVTSADPLLRQGARVVYIDTVPL